MKFIFLLLLLIIIFSCKEQAPKKYIHSTKYGFSGHILFMQNPFFSDVEGNFRVDGLFYFPPELLKENYFIVPAHSHLSSNLELRTAKKLKFLTEELKIPKDQIRDTTIIDSTFAWVLSNILDKLDQPILSNYYKKKTIYRLLVIPGMAGEYIMITLSKENDSTTVEIKIPKRDSIGNIPPKKILTYLVNDKFKVSNDSLSELSFLINCDEFNRLTYVENDNDSHMVDGEGFFLKSILLKAIMEFSVGQKFKSCCCGKSIVKYLR